MARDTQKRPRRRSRGRRANGRPSEAGPTREGAAACGTPVLEELCELSPFSVFCALWLGITERDAFAHAGAPAVAERFGLTQEQLESFLEEHDLRREDLRAASFDLESARLDIRVAPEGISRCELARSLFKDFRDSLANARGDPA